jgi:hypothetical protein
MPRGSSEIRASAVVLLALAAPAFAHQVVDQPSLGRLIASAEVIVRGTIGEPSRAERGALIASLRVDKTLKGKVSAAEITFASDIDHGIRYAAGERVLLFLSPAPPGSPARFTSPQVFSMRYPITSFDPTGYDSLVSGLLAVEREPAGPVRSCRLKEVLLGQVDSHERKVRLYAAEALAAPSDSGQPQGHTPLSKLSCATPRP